MAGRLEGALQLNEILFQDPIDSFPHRDNYDKVTQVVGLHATDIEALLAGDPASGAEVVAARDDEADLGTAIRKGDEIGGDAVMEGVLNDFTVKERSVPDDQFEVDTGEAIITGRKARRAAVQTIDPPDFSLGLTDPRIDVVHVNSVGTVATTTGTPAAIPEIERPPDNTVVLGWVFVRPSGLNPNVPLPIKDSNDDTNSFIILNDQRFFIQRDNTDGQRHPANIIRNGSFNTSDAGGAVENWTPTNASLVKDTSEKLFGENSGKITGDGITGGNFIEQELPSAISWRGKFLSVTGSMRLNTGEIAKNGRITIRMVGDTPESDFSVTKEINDVFWRRFNVVGYVDNSITAIFIRLEVDTVDQNTTVGFFDGIQVQVGKQLTEFEYPERIVVDDFGVAILPGGVFISDQQFQGDVEINGDLKVDGVADTDDALVAYAAFANSIG